MARFRLTPLHGVLAIMLLAAGTPLMAQSADAAAPRGAISQVRVPEPRSSKSELFTVRRDGSRSQRTQSATAATTDTFQNEILATGFDLPTTFEFLPDGRMLVGELQGRIKVLPPPYTQPDSALFLQITNIGSAGVQQGIYDIALDPGFATNHFYYVFYTLGSPNHDRVSRFTANATLTGRWRAVSSCSTRIRRRQTRSTTAAR